MRWALPFTAPVRLALSLTMARSVPSRACDALCISRPSRVSLTRAPPQADPSEGVVSPVHLALIAFCAPPFLLFTAGQNIFRLGDAELVSLTLLRVGLVAATLALLPSRGVVARSSGLVSAIAFLGGVAWMDVCADEVVSIFQALGRILGLPEALLGGTIMCWAASMGDLVATIAVVKRGMANMAVTSCFAGPVFQLLCGLGASLLFINVGRGVEVPVRRLTAWLCVSMHPDARHAMSPDHLGC
jgi:Ca2+/Na+ antiporter